MDLSFFEDTFDRLLGTLDWTKLVGIPLGASAVFIVAYQVARKIAERAVKVDLENARTQRDQVQVQLDSAKNSITTLNNQVQTSTSTIHQQTKTIQQLQNQLTDSETKRKTLTEHLYKFKKEYERLKSFESQYQSLNTEHSSLVAKLQSTLCERDQLQVDLEKLRKDASISLLRMKKAKKLKGYLLHAKALQSRPKFRLLSERNVPIIAVGALKGGVGKTTITSHLAGGFARKGYRVLVIDLDLQGSLCTLFLSFGKRKQLEKSKLLLQDFFNSSMLSKQIHLQDYCVNAELSNQHTIIDIVPTSDRLSYAEFNLTLDWLLGTAAYDPRFILRRALHRSIIAKSYDIIFIDCPPVLNISCTNALAAADYLLIPTILSGKSYERVTELIKAVQNEAFIKHLNSQLSILGVIANRTRFSELKGQEAINWQVNLPNSLHAVKTSHIKQFSTIIAQDTEIASNEDKYLHPKPSGRADLMFTDLVAEIEKELPHACRKSE